MVDITLRVNGATRTGSPEARKTLADFLRDDLNLTGTHIGCEHGVCGACTVIVDGRAVRSCLMLAVQATGSEVTTIEGLAPTAGWARCSKRCGIRTASSAASAHRDSSCRLPRSSAITLTLTSSRSAKRYPATSAGAPATIESPLCALLAAERNREH